MGHPHWEHHLHDPHVGHAAVTVLMFLKGFQILIAIDIIDSFFLIVENGGQKKLCFITGFQLRIDDQ